MTILPTLNALYTQRPDEVESWFGKMRAIAEPHFYTSVDLRHSGLRLVPVDTNLYPAGFNNLSLAARARAGRYAAATLTERLPDTQNLLIVPENHTRNAGYLENIAVLSDILRDAGYEVRIGTLASDERLELTSMTGRILHEEPLVQQHGKLATKDGFTADAIILNHDLSGGMQPLLENITQPILPPAELGWFRRRKSVHFATYQKLVDDFGATFGIDPWLISAYSHHCGQIDFKAHEGLECVAKAIDELIAKCRAKYAQYGITDEPYVYMKADSGTYGMGIMTVRSGADILEMNKKERNKMQVVKEGTRVSEVILQEGVPTVDKVEDKPAEPMVYMIDGLPVGGMYRVNGARDELGNLNAAGMEFVGMCDEQETSDVARQSVKECDFKAYGVVAAIAALAAGQEQYGEV